MTDTNDDTLEQGVIDAEAAFVHLWKKMPRSLRAERDNQVAMETLKGFFDAQLAAIDRKKRARVANALLAAVSSPLATPDAAPGDEDGIKLHAALQFYRMLERRQWEMVKAIVDLHKFKPEEVADIMDELRDTHCADCGLWLEDGDEHDECPAAADDVVAESDAEAVAAEPAATDSAAAPNDAVQNANLGPQSPAP